MEYPAVTIVVTTFFPLGEKGLARMDVARETIRSWWTHLRYDGDLRLHIADDGSPYPEFNAYRYWYHNYPTYSKQERHGFGASLNTGLRRAFETSDIAACFIDDWALTQNFDITPWVKLLMERNDVGMVRLQIPHPGISGRVEAFTEDWQSWGLRLDRYAYAFGHRPALYHRRLIESYGWFKEDCSAIDCEKDYAERFCSSVGPDIVLSLQHPWQHLESVELAYLNPNEEK